MFQSLVVLLVAFMMAVPSEVPSGGIKGRVFSRLDKQAVEQATVVVMQKARPVAKVETNDKGSFEASGLADGQYVLVVSAPGLLETRVKVTVSDGRVRNVFNVLLQEVPHVADDHPEALFGSSDIVSNLSRYYFPSLRDASRGLEGKDYYLAGVHLDGKMLLGSALSESFRRSTLLEGAQTRDFFGGFNGAVSIDGTASAFRSGFRAGLYSNNAFWYGRAQASYSTGAMHDGWVVSADIGAHTPSLSAYAGQQWGSAYLGADKIVNAKSRFSAAVLYANAPLSFLRYTYMPSERTSAYVTALGQFSPGNQHLHLAGGINSHLSSHWLVMGGADVRIALHDLDDRRMEAWAGAAYQLHRWMFNMAVQAGSLRQMGEAFVSWQGKAGVQYIAGKSRVWASAGGFHLHNEEALRWSGDVNWSFNANGFNVRTTAYALSRPDGLGYGAEVGFRLPLLIIPNLSVQGLGCVGKTRHFSGGLAWGKDAGYVSADILDDDSLFSLNLQGGKLWVLGRSRLGISASLRTLLSATSLPLPKVNYLINLFYKI